MLVFFSCFEKNPIKCRENERLQEVNFGVNRRIVRYVPPARFQSVCFPVCSQRAHNLLSAREATHKAPQCCSLHSAAAAAAKKSLLEYAGSDRRDFRKRVYLVISAHFAAEQKTRLGTSDTKRSARACVRACVHACGCCK